MRAILTLLFVVVATMNITAQDNSFTLQVMSQAEWNPRLKAWGSHQSSNGFVTVKDKTVTLKADGGNTLQFILTTERADGYDYDVNDVRYRQISFDAVDWNGTTVFIMFKVYNSTGEVQIIISYYQGNSILYGWTFAGYLR